MILKKGAYGDDRSAEFATTPDEVRRHPAYVRKLLAEDYKYPTWVAAKGDTAAMMEALSDVAFVRTLDSTRIYVAKQLPEATVRDPGVRDLLKARVTASNWAFDYLPEALRRDPELVGLALDQSFSHVKSVVLDDASPALVDVVRRHALAYLEQRDASVEKVPAMIRALPGFLEAVVTARPLAWTQLTAEERARVEPLFAASKLGVEAAKLFSERFVAKTWDRPPELWADAPAPVRKSDAYLAPVVCADPDVIDRAGLSPARVSVMFRRPASLDGVEPWKVARLSSKLSPETLALSHVRTPILAAIAHDASYLKHLPPSLRADRDVVLCGIARDPMTTARSVPIADLDADVLAQLEDAVSAALTRYGANLQWSEHVPEGLRESASLAAKLARAVPSLVLPEALAAKVADALATPEHVARTAAAWAARFNGIYSSDQRRATWDALPAAVRAHPSFVRDVLTGSPWAALELPKTPAEADVFRAVLRDVAFLTAKDRHLLVLAPHLEPEIVGHPEVRAEVARRLAEDARSFRGLPEVLRSDLECLRAAIGRDRSAVYHVPLPREGSPARAVVEAAWIALVDAHGVGDLPPPLAADPRFCAELLARKPSIYAGLAADHPIVAAGGGAALDDPRFWEHVGPQIFEVAKRLSPAELDDARVEGALVAALARSPGSYRELPDVLKVRHRVVEATLAAQPEALRFISVAALAPKTRALVEETVDRHLDASTWSWRDLGPELRSDPRVLERQLRRHPELVDRLADAERALAAPVLADPELALSSKDHFFVVLGRAPASVLDDARVRERALSSVEEKADRYQALPGAYKHEPRAILARVVADKHVSEHIPAAALTADVLGAIVERSPLFLARVPEEALPPAVKARAEALVLASLGPASKLSEIPRALHTLAVRRAVLDAAGPEGFAGYGLREKLYDAELWDGASDARVRAFLERDPEQLAVLGPRATRSVELAALALERARDPGDRASVLAAIDPALWDDAAFVDRAVALDPLLFARASAALRSDVARAKAAIVAHPANLDSAILARPDRLQILREAPLGALKYESGPWAEEPLLERLRGGTKDALDLSTRALAITAVAVAPARLAQVSPERLADPTFLAAVLDQSPAAAASWPWDKLSADARAALEAVLVARVKAAPSLFEHLPETMRADRALVEAVIDRHPSAITRAAGPLASDVALWKRALDADARLVERWRGGRGEVFDHAIAAATLQLEARRMAPKEVPKALYEASDDVVVAAMVGWGGHGLSWFNAWLGQPRVAARARELILARPQHAAEGLDKVPPALVQLLAGLPRDAATGGPNRAGLRFAIALADRTPALANSLPPALRDHDSVRSIAWSIDPPEGAVRQVRTAEERLAIVQKRPRALVELRPEERTRALVIAAVTLEGALLQHAPPALADDPEVVKAAVALTGTALRYASERLRADPELVAAAVQSDPAAFSFSLVRGAAARDIELIAVREGGLIEGRLERLKDQDFVLAFAEHLADNRYTGKVSLKEQSYRFEHHFDDPAFVEKLIALRPGFLTEMPERYWTPDNLATAAEKSAWYLTDGRGALDAKTLPPSTWERLARAHPADFMRSIGRREDVPEQDRPALEKAILAAIREDHTVTGSLPKVWWRDPERVGAMVRANPLVWESFGPTRRRWLEELQPDAAEHAKQFLEAFADSGFQRKRFAAKVPLLAELLQNRFAPRPDDARPAAVVVYPKYDHNGAFDRLRFDRLTERYRVMYYEAGSALEMAEAVRDGTRGGPAHVVVLAAHGSPESLDWGRSDQRPDQPYQFRPEHATNLAMLVPAERLAQGAKVVFDACSVGGGGKFRRNLVNCIADVWPQAWLQAAWYPSSAGNRMVFDDDGTFDRMDFRDSETLRAVPHHVVAPTRFDYGA